MGPEGGKGRESEVDKWIQGEEFGLEESSLIAEMAKLRCI